MITSTGNAKVKQLIQLHKKRKARDEAKVFLAEGLRMALEAPREQVLDVYVSESFYNKRNKELKLDAWGGKLCVFTDSVFAHVSDTKTPQGVLCVVRQMEYPLEKVIAGQCPMIMVLEHLQDPGNLGTILRTAEGAGVTGIVMDRECVDIYNPKTIRSTMGSIYRMPFCYVEDLKAAIGSLKEAGIGVYAAHLDGRHDYDEEDYGRPCAFLIGNEGNGLSQETAELADIYIKIPMEGQVESLNAAIAASVLMFEAGRQRRRHEG